jgi:hypothetical protein
MSGLIALVTVAVVVDGMRQDFPAGSELPELSPHDTAELKRMGAIEDPAETAAADKADARAQAKAENAFAAQKKAVAAAHDSTAQPNAKKK